MDFEKAIEAFGTVVVMEDESGAPGEWGFKAVKQVVKLRLKKCATDSSSSSVDEKKNRKNENVSLAIESLGKLLTYVDAKAVTKETKAPPILLGKPTGRTLLKYRRSLVDALSPWDQHFDAERWASRREFATAAQGIRMRGAALG